MRAWFLMMRSYKASHVSRNVTLASRGGTSMSSIHTQIAHLGSSLQDGFVLIPSQLLSLTAALSSAECRSMGLWIQHYPFRRAVLPQIHCQCPKCPEQIIIQEALSVLKLFAA